MTEIYTIALSSLGIMLAQYCKGFSDSVAYDEKAHNAWLRFKHCIESKFDNDEWDISLSVYEPYGTSALQLDNRDYGEHLEIVFNQPSLPTRYHIGTAWDAWHVMSRLSVIICYVTALCAGAYLGNTWWLFACAGCNAIAGWIGFNLGDRWKGSMWMRYIGRVINGGE